MFIAPAIPPGEVSAMSSSEVYASYETAREAYQNAVDIYLATQGRDMDAKAAAADDLAVAYKAFQAAIAALPKSRSES
jgi:hypothetical protein